jgi:ABC-type arginine transport system permease subunit
MRFLLDWAEEHWAGLGVTVSITCALVLAVVIAIAFNVVATREDRQHRDSAEVRPPVFEVVSLLTQQ